MVGMPSDAASLLLPGFLLRVFARAAKLELGDYPDGGQAGDVLDLLKVIGQLREQAAGYYQQGQDQVQSGVSAFEQTVRQQPLKSVLIAAGVGLLLGRLWAWMSR